MDVATILGLLLALVSMAYAVVAGGGSFEAFLDYPALACVFGGVGAALLLGFPLKSVVNLGRVYKVAVVNKVPDVRRLIDMLVHLAETARKEGLLALESKLPEIEDSFVVLGIQMAVDGSRPEIIEEVLRAEIESTARRHQSGKSLVETMGKYAPAFGMIGTLLGLVIMLGKMDDPNAIGPGMAVALLTTLYGALLANTVCGPVAEKLSRLNKEEVFSMEIALKGILAIQSGDNPRLVEQRLSIHLSASERRGARAA